MPPPARRNLALLLLALIVVLALVVAAVSAVLSRVGSLAPRWLAGAGETTVSQSVMVDRVKAVAKLVSTETTLRDVVDYRSRRFGSTKRSLVVVTGKVLTGFDLAGGTKVQVDASARRVRITLPAASVLAVEITELRTYDERNGLWNRFRPADRDTIYTLARRQLAATAGELELAHHAEQSARRLLTTMVAVDGYTTEVAFANHPDQATATPAETPDPNREPAGASR